jgi:nucleotide-binding universal stress UspA family protein
VEDVQLACEFLKIDARPRDVVTACSDRIEIAALATKEMVDLVVMGSAKGLVTNKVIRMTTRPVLAVSANQPAVTEVGLQKVTKILVATDFSEHSKRVVEYAFDLKRIFNATIYMLYVINRPRH